MRGPCSIWSGSIDNAFEKRLRQENLAFRRFHVAAYKGGSPDIPSSIDRIEGYSKTLREKYGVKFYDRIEEMCPDVDVVLLESVDGRPHLEQARPVLQARKPVFID